MERGDIDEGWKEIQGGQRDGRKTSI